MQEACPAKLGFKLRLSRHSKTHKVHSNFHRLGESFFRDQPRSMLDTPQRFPRAGSQSYPPPAAKPSADGLLTTVYFSPVKPEGVSERNWVQTDPK